MVIEIDPVAVTRPPPLPQILLGTGFVLAAFDAPGIMTQS